MSIDKKFTEKMQAWLLMDKHDVQSIQEGAQMVLQLTHNRYFYNQIMMRPEKMVSRVEYELKKHLKYRLENMTLEDVKVLEKQVLANVTPFVAPAPEPKEGELPQSDENKVVYRGKRADHDSLPADVQQMWTDNAERYKRIKQLYNTCMELEQPCDRYEYAQQLQEAWRTYHAVMQDYDTYVIKPNVDTLPPAEDLEKKYKNARSYISKNIDKLAEADKDNVAEYDALRNRLKERVAILVEGKQVIGDDLRAKLIALSLLDGEENAENDGANVTHEADGSGDKNVDNGNSDGEGAED